MNRGRCPETSREVNGWSRHGRLKALPKAAEANSTSCSAKALRGDGLNACLKAGAKALPEGWAFYFSARGAAPLNAAGKGGV